MKPSPLYCSVRFIGHTLALWRAYGACTSGRRPLLAEDSLRPARRTGRTFGGIRGKAQGIGVSEISEAEVGESAGASGICKETKHRLIELARVYGLHEDADSGASEHKLFLEGSEEVFDLLRAAEFRSWEISAAYDFLLEAGPAGLRALLGDWRGTTDPGLIRSFADTLFELAEQGRIDLSTAISRIGLHVPRKMKELVLVGINLSERYRSGVSLHVTGARRLGATDTELADVALTCVLTAGIPAWFELSDLLTTDQECG